MFNTKKEKTKPRDLFFDTMKRKTNGYARNGYAKKPRASGVQYLIDDIIKKNHPGRKPIYTGNFEPETVKPYFGTPYARNQWISNVHEDRFRTGYKRKPGYGGSRLSLKSGNSTMGIVDQLLNISKTKFDTAMKTAADSYERQYLRQADDAWIAITKAAYSKVLHITDYATNWGMQQLQGIVPAAVAVAQNAATTALGATLVGTHQAGGRGHGGHGGGVFGHQEL